MYQGFLAFLDKQNKLLILFMTRYFKFNYSYNYVICSEIIKIEKEIKVILLLTYCILTENKKNTKGILTIYS